MPAHPRTVAVTGATGFIGRSVTAELRRTGMAVRALVRRPPTAPLPGAELVTGDLADERALAALIAGADAVVHLAGAVAASRADDFQRVNARGTAVLAGLCARSERPPRFISMSSLAAREPGLSPYAASKAAAERELSALAGRLPAVILRPPAVYGPGDRATLPILAQLARGWLVMPGAGRQRFSLLHVDDLAALVAVLVSGPFPRDRVLEPDDGTEAGYSWRELADCAARANGRPVRAIPVPRAAFTGLALLAEAAARLTGGPPRLARGKVAELFHADWLCEPASLNGVPWAAAHRFADGFEGTIAWYRRAGWLAA